jgi:hypothetical protein
MTVKASQSAIQVLPDLGHTDLERRCPPVAEYLAGVVVVMNICATVLSMMV